MKIFVVEKKTTMMVQVDERKMWVKYSCNGGQDVTIKQSTQFCHARYSLKNV